MNIVFTTRSKYKEAPSTVLNLSNLQRLSGIEGVRFQAYPDSFTHADVILFMGYDPDIRAARAAAPHARIGVIDPRPRVLHKAAGADFLLVNGPEMAAAVLCSGIPSLYYPIYQYEPKRSARQDASHIIVCYHGNKQHAMAMHPVVSSALDRLARALPNFSIRLRCIYTRAESDPIDACFLPVRVPVEHVAWHPGVYAKELAEADIGIVPNFVPLRFAAAVKTLTCRAAQGATSVDWIVRFKPTSNPGRIFSFAMHGIPVVADCYPSAASVIVPGVSGFMAHDADSWFQALLFLCRDAQVRQSMGNALYTSFCASYSPEVLNLRLVDFLKTLQGKGSGYHEKITDYRSAQ